MARKSNQYLTVMLLDFEKAYDRVDWSFLEGTMAKMGFAENWIKGISSLYKSATSKVLLAGGKGSSFQLTRSVRQGCPMAPFLFLMYAEAMSTFLRSEIVGIQGLSLPNTDECLVDSEFADDTALYVKGTRENLHRVEHALTIFCLGLGAKINWNKIVAFWVGESGFPNWKPHPQFLWILEGKTT